MINPIKFLKGLIVSQDSTLTPASIQITPAGTASTTTTIQSSQTANRTLTLPDATDTVVAQQTTDTLKNKTFDSTSTATGIKIASLTPDGTHTITMPAATDTLVGKSTTDVLTNKDLTSGTNVFPTLNQNTTGTAANITATSNNTLTSLPSLSLPGSQVSGNISGTASNITATSNSTLTSLPSLSLPGSQVSGNISGNSANVTGIVAAANGGTGVNSTATFPSSGTVATVPSSGVVTSSGSALSNVAYGSAGQVLTINTSGTPVFTSAQAGTKNYLSGYTASLSGGTANPGNGNFELGNTTGWSLAHTTLSGILFPQSVASAGVPFDSTHGGSAASGNLSLTAFTGGNHQLAGTYSGSLSSAAISTPGDMLISNAFYIDKEDQAQVLNLSFSYSAYAGSSALNFSGTSSNSYAIYIYDVTNAQWIQPSGVYCMSAVNGKSLVQFQTSSNGTQYQVAIININASTNTFQMLFDDFVVGPPQTAGLGMVGSDPVNYTPTTAGLGTLSNVTLQYSRRGKFLVVEGTFTTGTPTATQAQLGLPSGLTIDSNFNSGGVANAIVGSVAQQTTSANLVTVLAPPGATYVVFGVFASGYIPTQSQNGNIVFNASANQSIYFEVPIQGWSSDVPTVSSYDGRAVGCRIANVSSQSIANGGQQPIQFTSTIYDTHSAWDSTNYWYTAPVSGIYRISGNVFLSGSGLTVSGRNNISLYKNGSNDSQIGRLLVEATGQQVAGPFVGTVKLAAGDKIQIQFANISGSTLTFDGAASDNTIDIDMIAGSQQILAGQMIAAKYGITTGQSLTSGSATTINWNNKVFDTTGSMDTSTGIFTVPTSGFYSVTAMLEGPASATGYTTLSILKNGTTTAAGTEINNSTYQWSVQIEDLMQCVAGDQITVQATQTSGSSYTIPTSTVYSGVTIKRVN